MDTVGVLRLAKKVITSNIFILWSNVSEMDNNTVKAKVYNWGG